ARLARKHPETFNARAFAPAAFTLGLFAGAALAWLAPWLAALYAGTLALYAAVVLAVSLSIAWRARRPALLPWLPLAFAALHLGAGAGILLEWAFGKKPPARAEGQRVFESDPEAPARARAAA